MPMDKRAFHELPRVGSDPFEVLGHHLGVMIECECAGVRIMIPALNIKATCSGCHRRYWIQTLEFNAATGELALGVAHDMAAIELAKEVVGASKH